jgi:hypothetical protein
MLEIGEDLGQELAEKDLTAQLSTTGEKIDFV